MTLSFNALHSGFRANRYSLKNPWSVSVLGVLVQGLGWVASSES
jgi:hypothetical protein